MLSLILFPIMIFFMFNLLFIRGFIRSTGLRILPTRVCMYFFAGGVLTLVTYLILILFERIFGGWYDAVKGLTSPIIEDILKTLLLSFMTSKVYVAGEYLQMYRQRLVSGVFLGLTFGLVETYLYSFVQTESVSALLGSIPLQMVIGGSIGIVLSRKTSPHSRNFSLFLIMLGHLLYNQGLRLPQPLNILPLLILLVSSIVLINLLNAPRDPSEDI